MNKICFILFALTFSLGYPSLGVAQTPLPIKRFLASPAMRGASFSVFAKDVETGEVRFDYDSERCLTPASVMKLITTATALELLGDDFRFETVLEYDGEVKEGVLHGNLYIRGGGDPTLGSAFFAEDRQTYVPGDNTFIPQWMEALKKADIHSIHGRVIADERIFDYEGISRKWLYEDLGSYYGTGSYGISVFDNQYQLLLRTGIAGSKPEILKTVPTLSSLEFKNYLKAAAVRTDSSYILGMPFAKERYLYGVVPAGRTSYKLKGDIPDPALFLAEYTTERLIRAGFEVSGEPACFRLLEEEGAVPTDKRKTVCVTYSPPLAEIARVTNEVSHNLFADALLKVVGLRYSPSQGEVIASFDRGVQVLLQHWKARGIDVSSLQLYDGSGLAVTDKLTARFITDVLVYMKHDSPVGSVYAAGIPRAGLEGSVRNFLKGSRLQGNARLKSGSMSGVKAYAGYIRKDGKEYAVAMLLNNYQGEGRDATKALEELFLLLF